MERLLLECAIRALLIATAAAVVLRIMQVRTATARHAAWAGVVVLMLLLPLWTAWGPKASVRVLPPLPERNAIQAVPAVSADSMAGVWLRELYPEASEPAPPPSGWHWRDLLLVIYALGASTMLVRLAVGTFRAHRLNRRASLQDDILTSAACSAPVTVGWFRPKAILPGCWREWPEAQLDAVLTHEREHARRRDPLFQWFALLNRAIFWFHPLAWWLERRIAVLAEEACDTAVLERGHQPQEYSKYLLDIARAVQLRGTRIDILGTAMSGSFLAGRIRKILEGAPRPRVSRARLACSTTLFAVGSLVFGSATLDHVPQRGRTAATQPMVLAQVRALPALAALVPAPAAPVRPEPVTAASLDSPQIQGVVKSSAPIEDATVADLPVRAFVPLLFPVTRVEALYPEAARTTNIQASVDLLLTIDPQGLVRKVEVLSGPEVMRQAAVDAVKQWTFRPVLRDQIPVYAMTTAMVNFRSPTGSGERYFNVEELSAAERRKSDLRKAMPRSPEQVLADFEQDANGATGITRFYRLTYIAKAAFNAGAISKAEEYANELLGMAAQYPRDWNHGNALHDGNVVLGRIAIKRGNLAEAKRRLLEAGKTPGSPQLNSFGPNMTLANDLVQTNERATVLEYLELCRKFWKLESGIYKLNQWSAMVRGGGMPEFGANLLY